MRVAASVAALLALVEASTAFAPVVSRGQQQLQVNNRHQQPLFSAPVDEKTEETTSSTKAEDNAVPEIDPDAEGLPWWWEGVFKLPIMQTGEQGEEIIFGDSANVLRTNIEQIYGGYPSLDGCPLAEGALDDIAEGTMFVGLQNYYQNYGSPYKLCFGPKSFLVISDPVQARHILRDANTNYDKVSVQ